MGGMDVVDELLAEVKAARRAQTAEKRHTDRVKELLVAVRVARPDLGIADIEEMIGRFYDRATISRITYPTIKERRTAADGASS
jgi:hypothetical protein